MNLLQSIAAVALALAGMGAGAAPITFALSTSGVVSPTHPDPWVLTAGGVTLTLSNPQGQTGFVTDPDGLFLARGGLWYGRVTAFDLRFSSSVKIVSYEIGYVALFQSEAPLSSFALTGGVTGAASALNNPLTAVGPFNVSSDYILNANQTGRFTASGGGGGLSQLKFLTVETVAIAPPTGGTVPEPSTLALLAAAAIGGFAARRRAA
jgi:PEP-CTERM motif